MRDRIWSNLIRTKYQGLYLCHFNSYVRSFDRITNILLAVASSGTIGAWLIWEQFPFVWATILGISQVIIIIKPLLPYLKDKEHLAECYMLYESIHLDYERLWYDVETNNSESDFSDEFFELRDKELIIVDKLKSIKVSNYKFIENKVRPEWGDYLRSNYGVKIEDNG